MSGWELVGVVLVGMRIGLGDAGIVGLVVVEEVVKVVFVGMNFGLILVDGVHTFVFGEQKYLCSNIFGFDLDFDFDKLIFDLVNFKQNETLHRFKLSKSAT